MKVLTFGELLLRLSSPGYNKLFQKDYLETSFCGSEANVAVSLSNFGIFSSFLTKLPDNDIGYAAEKELNYFKVDTSKVIFGDGRMGILYLEKGASQRASKVIYDRRFSSLAEADKQDFNWDSLLQGFDWFHWSGITPALSQNAFDILLDALKTAKKLGITVSCDINYRHKLWNPKEAQSAMKKLLHYVDVCICNEEDAQLSLGIDYLDLSSKNERYELIAKSIEKDYGCSIVAFTLRESISASINGWSAMLYHSNKFFYSNKYEIQLVDRVGGGDSFAAGLIYALIKKMSEKEAVEFATAASCLNQTIEGDFNRVSADDVFLLIETNGNGRIQR